MKCKKYFVKIDSLGFPVPGTMQGFDKDPCKEGLIELKPVPDGIEPGVSQCFHPTKLRYFYQLDKRGQVLPNSLITSNTRPRGLFVEFKKLIGETLIPITIKANAVTKVEGDPDPTLTYTVTPALLPGDTLVGSLTRTSGETPGSYPINLGTLSNPKYTITYTAASLTITVAPDPEP